MGVRLTTPVTIITGFLGSGKTTLVNRLLRETHGQKIAVIENEFGEVGVDAEFLATTGEETVIQLANGCLCCTVRGDLALALQELVTQSDAGEFQFDRVLIETTGLADPGPVIQTFLAETAIETRFHLDGVVTLVDALHAPSQMEHVENRSQIAYADRLLVVKSDLADAAQRAAVEDAVVLLNPRAPVIACDLRSAPIVTLLAHLFDTRGFALDYVPPEEIQRARRGLELLAAAQGAGRLRPLGFARHTQDVTSCVFVTDQPLDLGRLNEFIDAAISRYGERLWRCKGIVYAQHHRPRLVLQGVQGLVQISGGTIWRAFEPRRTTLVFIGQRLERDWIVHGLEECEIRQSASL
jgi:G3E family GTPase